MTRTPFVVSATDLFRKPTLLYEHLEASDQPIILKRNFTVRAVVLRPDVYSALISDSEKRSTVLEKAVHDASYNPDQPRPRRTPPGKIKAPFGPGG